MSDEAIHKAVCAGVAIVIVIGGAMLAKLLGGSDVGWLVGVTAFLLYQHLLSKPQ